MVFSNLYNIEFFIYIMITLIIAKVIYVSANLKRVMDGSGYDSFRMGEQSVSKDYSEYKDEKIEDPKSNTQEQKTIIRLPSGLSRFTDELKFFETCTDSYKILGCSSFASSQELKRGYYHLLKKWHPDRIMGMNATQEELKQATKIVQIINIAYAEVQSSNNTHTKSA